MATSSLSSTDVLRAIEPAAVEQDDDEHAQPSRAVALTHDALFLARVDDRENALSQGRSFSPSVASSIATNLAPSLFTLEFRHDAIPEEEVARGSSSRTSGAMRIPKFIRQIWQNPLVEDQSRTNDVWSVPVRLVAGNQDQRRWEAIAILDYQCRDNFISTQTVERQALDVELIEGLHIRDTINGQPMHSPGYIDVRVYSGVKVQPRRGRAPSFHPKYYRIRFYVVVSDLFDVIIGHRTLEDEHIYMG
ncbi:hypothetical protein DE146DRAFT_651576 [Phaeosphaeria sp. MPI-PUGE-AT-0046c]|nr:hypothetical protein DE146DRAFT_651576 [Phaeosphaeria sp. MPI-PUGE-AT-0046c]